MRHLRRIAWSRSGLVAFIDDRQRVCVTWSQCVDGEQWDWVPPVFVPHPSDSKPVSSCWAVSSFDLAIADELGRIQIVTIGSDAVPKTQIVASAVRDDRKTAVELDKIVGVHWLQAEKNLIVPKPNAKNGGAGSAGGGGSKPWESSPPLGPFHPMKTGGAFLAINGNGMLRMSVQTPSSRYVEFDASMPNAHCVSHASFSPMGRDSLSAVLINGIDNTLMVYEIKVKWEPVASWPSKPNFVSISVHPVATSALEDPQEAASPLSTYMPNNSQKPVELGIFRCIGSPKVETWVVYAHKVLKFQIIENEELLHPSFFELFGTADPVPPAPCKVWQILGPEVSSYESRITDFVVQRFQAVLIHENGELTAKNSLENSDISQLGEAGSKFNRKDLSEAAVVCFSPTGSCAAIIEKSLVNDSVQADNNTDSKSKSKPKLKSKSSSDDDESMKLSTNMEGGTNISKSCSVRLDHTSTDRESAVKVGLVLATYYACVVFNSDQYDDLLKVSRSIYTQQPEIGEFQNIFFDVSTKETQRLLSVNLGPPDDPHKVERLMVIPSPSQRWLAFLISLGTSKNWQRTPGCCTAWSLSHLQSLAFSITWTLKRSAQRPRMDVAETARLEILASQYHLEAILGPMKWATDLIIRIAQEMYDASISDSPESVLVNKPNVFASLMMSSVSRYLLRFFLRGIRSLTGASKNAAEHEARLNALMNQQASSTQDANMARELRSSLSSLSNYGASRTLKKLVTQLQSMPVKLDAFERVVVEVDNTSKASAVSQQLDSTTRAGIDSALIRHAKLPESYATTVIPHFLTSLRKNSLPTTDVPKMYFYDTTWLASDGIPYPDSVDGLRKRVILPNEDVQKCTRCGIVTVKASDASKTTTQWLQLFQRQCVCGGSWLYQKDRSKLTPVD